MTTLLIDGIAAGGDGVGRHPDGRVVFVPRTSPGDVAEVSEVERRPRFVRARLLNVKEPGADRITPECLHYTSDDCGGCQLQHLAYDAQLGAKRRIVGDALRRIGKLAVEDPPVVESPRQWRYRAKISLAVAETSAGTVIGLHRYTEPQRVFELRDCLITRQSIMALWESVRPHGHLLPQPLDVVVLKEDREGGLHLVAVAAKPHHADGAGNRPWDARPLARAVGDATISYWWKPWRGAERVVAGPRTGFPALSFEQVNPELAAVIRAEAVNSLGDITGCIVWDLYGGVGETAALLAERGATVWSVDSDRSAKEWAVREKRSGVRHVSDRVENVLGKLPKPGAVVVNPPRAGLTEPVAAWLDAWGSKQPGVRLAYVSCDPATLSRDLTRMPSFSLERLKAFDVFPQTSHIESLAVLQAST